MGLSSNFERWADATGCATAVQSFPFYYRIHLECGWAYIQSHTIPPSFNFIIFCSHCGYNSVAVDQRCNITKTLCFVWSHKSSGEQVMSPSWIVSIFTSHQPTRIPGGSLEHNVRNVQQYHNIYATCNKRWVAKVFRTGKKDWNFNCLLWKEYDEFSLYIEFSKHCKSAQVQVTVHLAQLDPFETTGTFKCWCIYTVWTTFWWSTSSKGQDYHSWVEVCIMCFTNVGARVWHL